MASLISGYNYDIFISYRQKDNKGDHWVSEFVEALKTELESTFKEEISVYFDINPHDGLLETHDVDASLKEKLKCLIFIPIISRTYCDPKSFAWEHEFMAFVESARKDQFGLMVRLPNGNMATRVLPVKIHDLDPEDIKECESVLRTVLRGIEFIYREPGVNKPQLKTDPKYPIQINKAANSIREIISGLRNGTEKKVKEEHHSDFKKTQGKEKSIIVLPFKNMSSDPEQEYFSDGLTEEIITNLAHIKDLLVISRSSAMTFKGTGKTIPEIALAVNVSYVLEGSVRKAGKKLRITAQLIDAVNDVHIWADSYDGIMDDIFDIQEKVAVNISKELKLKVSDVERSLLISKPFRDALSFEFYLRAKQEINSLTEQSINRGIDYLEKALEIEGDNSTIYAELAHAYYQFWNMGVRINDSDLVKANNFIKKSFELDSESPDAHFVSGLLATTGGDCRQSIVHLRKVLLNSPNHANALFWLAQLFAILGFKKQAFELNDKLIKVDPFSPLAVSQPLIIHLYSGDFKSALAVSEKLGNDDFSLLARGYMLTYLQDTAQASALYDRISDYFKNTYVFKVDLMLLNSLMGKFNMMPGLLGNSEFLLWARNDFYYSFQIAETLAVMGEKEQALDWLENSVERGNFNYPFLNEYDPFLENLREDARFRKIIKRIKTEWENFA
jgi:TolB-like protein